MKSLSAAVLCGDLRQCYLAGYLNRLGYHVACFGTVPFFYDQAIDTGLTFEDTLCLCRLILCPVPFSKDGIHIFGLNETIFIDRLFKYIKPPQILAGGNIPGDVLKRAEAAGIAVFDYMSSDMLAQENAAITAEGMLQCILEDTPFALYSANVLITGFGRCGLALGERLNGLCKSLTVYDIERSRACLARDLNMHTVSEKELLDILPCQNIIVNTAPGIVLKQAQLEAVPKDCYVFDLASAPGCIDKSSGIKPAFPYHICPGLPGKTAPKTAGEALGRSLRAHLLD